MTYHRERHHRSHVRRWLPLVALALVLGGAAALGHTPATRAATQPAVPRAALVYVSAVSGTDALLAVVVDERSVLAYVCDGTPTGVSLWGWFAGELSGPQLTLVSTNGHALLLDLSGATPVGELVTATGGRFSFTTEAATGPAALWRAQGLVENQPVLAGWVVLADGQQRGAQVRAGTIGTVGVMDPDHDFNRPQMVDVGGSILAAHAVGVMDPDADFNR